MKTTTTPLLLLGALLFVSCNGKSDKTTTDQEIITNERNVETTTAESTASSNVPASEKIDLNNKGVGPVKELTLDELDQALAQKGEEIYKNMCTACHKPDKKFIGPAPKGILDRRSPEWVMNMILSPETMLEQDPLAKELLKEFNGAPMANQNLTEQEARAVLEYFRTL
ncbi:cytochrome c [Myroides marinus]|uniref:Cytochrome C n=1 Tax=Myroides marinus TaxID=703342 RepID=A0A161SD25_9FLAO|nr:cytochrome c [Myroides marinus]KZE78435.1 cytochrome C [Myroides marinus]MDM1348190.1 cytochrome c [Myroides marinus]MDM1352494.1 cytochrome c [Myroides marinus]MDM1359706.1 cytochrome c [Myroides marinus]MDM1366801.1 cytochrome c [Myroides marinus]